MTARRERGFTLLELLVALAVFAVLSVLAYGGVSHIVRLDSGLREAGGRHQGLELALTLIEQDLRHAVGRGVRDELGDAEPALEAGLRDQLLNLTRLSPDLAVAGSGPALRRIRYRLDADGTLYRDVWDQLDRTPSTRFGTRRLLRGLSGLSLRFFDAQAWTDYWPRAEDGPAANALPRGLEIRIDFGDGRSMRRVVART